MAVPVEAVKLLAVGGVVLVLVVGGVCKGRNARAVGFRVSSDSTCCCQQRHQDGLLLANHQACRAHVVTP